MLAEFSWKHFLLDDVTASHDINSRLMTSLPLLILKSPKTFENHWAKDSACFAEVARYDQPPSMQPEPASDSSMCQWPLLKPWHHYVGEAGGQRTGRMGKGGEKWSGDQGREGVYWDWEGGSMGSCSAAEILSSFLVLIHLPGSTQTGADTGLSRPIVAAVAYS